jgi:hypothetical protein
MVGPIAQRFPPPAVARVSEPTLLANRCSSGQLNNNTHPTLIDGYVEHEVLPDGSRIIRMWDSRDRCGKPMIFVPHTPGGV